MANRQWLETVKRQLVENRLPTMYIERFMEELSDHFEDLMEDTMKNEKDCVAQLGEPAQVADTAVVTYRQRTFFGRHPIVKFLVFGVSPLAAMLLTFILAMGMMILLCFLGDRYYGPQLDSYFRSLDDPALIGGWIMSTVTLILPAILLTLLYCRWVRRAELGRRWMLLACIMVAFLPMLMTHAFTISDIAGESTYRIGLSLPPTTVQQYVQLLVPLAVGLWYMWRSQKQQPTGVMEEPLQAAA